ASDARAPVRHRPAVDGQCRRARVRALPGPALAGDGGVRRLRAAARAPRPAGPGRLAAAPLTARRARVRKPLAPEGPAGRPAPRDRKPPATPFPNVTEAGSATRVVRSMRG